MFKDKIKGVVNFILKHSKIAFPLLIIVAVAVTVSIALNMGRQNELEQKRLDMEALEDAQQDETNNVEVTDAVPMQLDEGSPLRTLLCVFYSAVAYGESDTLQEVCYELPSLKLLSYKEKANYIESYPVLEVYTKPGYEEGSFIAFVYYKVVFKNHEEQVPGIAAHYICTNEQGELYINEGEVSEEVAAYIEQMASQDDVVEFYNRVDVEYNELLMAHPELLEYINEMNSQVSIAVGTALADMNATEEQDSEATDEGQATTNVDAAAPEQPTENVVQYATATTTVNIRTSDSQQADKDGKVPGGSRVEVLEQKLNGWSKIKYDGQEGYIKSEYLELVESAEGVESVGTVTATTNINVRSSADENAERLGVLAGGDTAELIATENDWCKIKYNGKVGYVKAEFVQ